jgi:hypothetical protein
LRVLAVAGLILVVAAAILAFLFRPWESGGAGPAAGGSVGAAGPPNQAAPPADGAAPK